MSYEAALDMSLPSFNLALQTKNTKKTLHDVLDYSNSAELDLLARELDDLRDLREARRLSLYQISAATRVHAIFHGDLDNIRSSDQASRGDDALTSAEADTPHFLKSEPSDTAKQSLQINPPPTLQSVGKLNSLNTQGKGHDSEKERMPANHDMAPGLSNNILAKNRKEKRESKDGSFSIPSHITQEQATPTQAEKVQKANLCCA
ncbi:uncharacterized protein BYT42DRAFT_102628 [Radiomyces spectabilis]|uniref:uncharacterized protein n=1 Tax=Radiomyces spectabilis TaxID=64574 RepID=UPI0022203900|nr:uncharacterized protein BYT42DRAFT_102628 [Radiomyces spectabilis]KAI8369268.1 hypothetical protein BYT42DRAFT_102628 [Radiomyces spectabilis]